MMRNIWILFKRELLSYFSSPLAYVFIVVFLVLSGICTFYFGNFFLRGQADLVPFFSFHPWLYTIFIPAVSMRLWSEERKSGTIELLFTLPVSIWQAVLSKYLATFVFIAIALCLTFPLWVVVNYLGHPDNGVILASYVGSLLMAGGYLAIGACISSLTKNQVIAFIFSLLLCLVVNVFGNPTVIHYLDTWLPSIVVDAIRNFSFLTNFETISRGLIDLRCILYFATLISFGLFANAVAIELKKAD